MIDLLDEGPLAPAPAAPAVVEEDLITPPLVAGAGVSQAAATENGVEPKEDIVEKVRHLIMLLVARVVRRIAPL